MNNELRWKQRFQNFEKAFAVFQRRIDEYEVHTDEEAYQMALVQGYEIIIELAWKVMKDYLENVSFISEQFYPLVRDFYFDLKKEL
ncbi:MAG: nucleotidyltransferase substrate binding protein [Patescibacteria group bacterium]